ncbi:MAG: SusD/RagB family nutrient-binding outer membrane lipoprotein [Ginsengibacter sp.]
MKRLIFSLAIFGGVFGFTSCKKSLLDINQNPNSASYSTPQLTMPVALENAARRANTSYTNLGFWIGYYATSSGFSKPVETYTYDITSTYLAGVWDNLYNNLEDFNYVEQQAVLQKFPVYEAIAKVMKAYDFHQLVDLWGKVPYSDALRGDSGKFSPKFDEGQTIYEDLVKQIDAAVVIFNNPSTGNSISSATDASRILLYGDLITTGGNPAFLRQWVKFSNTLKLKLLVQQSAVAGRDAYIKQNLTGLTSDDFLGLGEDALINPGYTTATAQLNPWYGLFYKSYLSSGDNYNSTVASDYAATSYNSNNDARISYFYTKSGDTYQGSIFGDPAGNSKAAKIGAPSLDPTGPAWLMVAAESLFLQAEAVQRGYLAGDAQSLYETAIKASFMYTGQTDSSYEAYMAQASPDIQWNLATDKIKLIITQKWFAMNGIDILAAYNDFRRTGFPDVPLSTDLNSKGKIPVRLFYPQRETLLNTDNVLAAGTVDVFNTKVFWDK